jgi:hypothetical protein
MPSPDFAPAKECVVLLEMSYGAASVLRMNDSQEDINSPLGLFVASPPLKVTLPPITGMLDVKPVEVELPYTQFQTFLEPVTSGRAFSEVYARCWRWTRTPGYDRLEMLFSGRLSVATRNPSGRQDIVKLQLATLKAETKRKVGLIVDSKCQWTFGDAKTCTKNLTPLHETGAITAFTRNVLTITGLSSHIDRYWQKGRIEHDGVSLTIRGWTSGTTFKVNKLLPKEWEETITTYGSISVTVIPGCDKLYDTCNTGWSNAVNFRGSGFAIPVYNPLYENPGATS